MLKKIFKSSNHDKKKPELGQDRRWCPWQVPIDQDSPFKKTWDIFISTIILYLLIALPLYISFYKDTLHINIQTTDQIIDVLFMLDIPLTFLTTIEDDKGCQVDDPLYIGYSYLKSGWFFIDFISVIPPSVVGGFKYLKIIKLFRAIRLLRLLPLLQANFELKNAHVSIFKYFLLILTVAHISGCFFYFIAVQNGLQPNSWVNNYMPNGAGPNSTIGGKYMTSLYWAITMMSTIGFGDITPGNTYEVLYAILTMMIGAATFAYSVTNMCSVVFGMDVEGAKFAGMQDRMKHLLERRAVQKKIRKKVRKYLLYKYHVSTVTMFGGFNVLDNLSCDLKEDVLQNFCEGLFKSVDILHLFGPRFLRLIAYHLQAQVFGDGEPIILAGTFCDRFFMLAQGEIELLAGLYIDEHAKAKVEVEKWKPKNQTIESMANSQKLNENEEKHWINHASITAQLAFELKEGCSFNEIGCLLGRPSTLTVFSNRFCDVYSLTRCSYLSIVKKLYPDDMTKLFTKLIEHSKNVGDLDFSLNLPPPDETDEPSPNERTTGKKQKKFYEPVQPADKMEILRRNMLYIKRHNRIITNADSEKKNMILKPNIFYDWDIEKIKRMSRDENFLEFWNNTEGFITPVSPLSIMACAICHKKNTDDSSYILPLHKRLCANDKCKQFGQSILSIDDVHCWREIENLPTIYDSDDIHSSTYVNRNVNQNDPIMKVRSSIKDVNAKIQELQKQIEEDNRILESLKNKKKDITNVFGNSG